MDGPPPQPSYEMPPPRSPGGRDSAGGPPPQPSYEMPPPRSPGGRRDPAGGPPPQPSYEMPPPRPSYDEAPRSPPREAPPRYATFASPVKDEPAADEPAAAAPPRPSYDASDAAGPPRSPGGRREPAGAPPQPTYAAFGAPAADAPAPFAPAAPADAPYPGAAAAAKAAKISSTSGKSFSDWPVDGLHTSRGATRRAEAKFSQLPFQSVESRSKMAHEHFAAVIVAIVPESVEPWEPSKGRIVRCFLRGTQKSASRLAVRPR